MNESEVVRWRGYALQCAVGLGLRGEDVEDAAQDALIRLLEAWGRPTGDPHGYYARTARHAVIDYADRERRRRHEELGEAASPPLVHDPYDAVDDAVAAGQRLDAARAALTAYEAEVVGRLARGDTRTEIARDLGRTYTAIKRACQRARDKLSGP